MEFVDIAIDRHGLVAYSGRHLSCGQPDARLSLWRRYFLGSDDCWFAISSGVYAWVRQFRTGFVNRDRLDSRNDIFWNLDGNRNDLCSVQQAI